MIVVNFFGAPGSGKTTAALGIAGYLKRKHLNAEYVSEFAKDQVWIKSHSQKVKVDLLILRFEGSFKCGCKDENIN